MQKLNRLLSLILLLAIAVLVYYWYAGKNTGNSRPQPVVPQRVNESPPAVTPAHTDQGAQSIEALTKEAVVVPYVKQTGHLPDYYITKREARNQGWEPSSGNLCNVLPGRAIGGDRFSNRERALPEKEGRKWFEADINFSCGRRNADRLLFSNDRLVFVTKDHYQTFQQK
ncbi:ribonuclease domain-containing protein [Niabella soli]|uniref:Ribonuclease n=1 Tax=Niabella soli DSM 19437 TaxID=929713 RepID=W0EY23_9BACT|nr:ribonuclease domain-containing protein [Niabella soli]AHF15685.1 ribonuclease [Niabella soli DSM 19437]